MKFKTTISYVIFLGNIFVHALNCANDDIDCDRDREKGLDLLVGTADGSLHAIDSVTNEKLWSVDTGGPLLSSFQQVKYCCPFARL